MLLQNVAKVLAFQEAVVVVDYDPSLSALFVFFNFVEDCLRGNGTVIYVSFNQSLDSLRIASSKMALRIDVETFHFVAFRDVMSKSPTSSDNILKCLQTKISPLLSKDQTNLIIFDDFDVLHDLGCVAGTDLQFLQKLRMEMRANSQILLGSCNPEYESLFNISNIRFRLRPIGAGFGKNVTGEMNIFQRDLFSQSCGSTHTFHYFVGERNVQIFCPGSIQNLM